MRERPLLVYECCLSCTIIAYNRRNKTGLRPEGGNRACVLLLLCSQAHSSVMSAVMAVMINEITKVIRSTPASSPIRSMAAAAF
jgi:hypothetical protein